MTKIEKTRQRDAHEASPSTVFVLVLTTAAITLLPFVFAAEVNLFLVRCMLLFVGH